MDIKETLIFRKSTKKDIEKIMNIINEAKIYFKNNNIDQWQNNYPNENSIYEDINKNESYVLEQDGKIVATVALSFNGEKAYENIDGKWLSTDKFCVIHRIAITNSSKGSNISQYLMNFIEKISLQNNTKSIKVDTHEDNIVMQKFLKKNNYSYCGKVYYKESKVERIVFEKLLK